MSHNIYRRKAFLRTPDNRILSLICVADSSVTVYNRRTGREHHEASWWIDTLGYSGLLVPEEIFKIRTEERLKYQIQQSQLMFDKYDPGKKVQMTDVNYYGDRYPTGSSYKAMRSFWSMGRTFDADEQLRIHPITVSLMTYNDERNKKKEKWFINDIDSLLIADEGVTLFHQRHFGESCVLDLTGLEEETAFKHVPAKIA